jgi:hypothetical protein
VDEVVDMHGALVSKFGKEVSCRTVYYSSTCRSLFVVHGAPTAIILCTFCSTLDRTF